MRNTVTACALGLALLLAACGGPDPRPASETYGASPPLPEARAQGIPTIKIAPVEPWPEDAAPVAPEGFAVSRYAAGLDHPRWMTVLPNGDVLVAQASTERRRGGGVAGWVENRILDAAGATTASANSIMLLRDGDADGVVDSRSVFLDGLKQPFGMALIGNHFYVANTDALLRFAYTPGAAKIDGAGEQVLALPYNAAHNGHWTRDLLASADGTKLYISVGSVSNVPTDGEAFALEERRAAILELDLASGEERVFASGLRNPNGLAWEPVTGALWATVNERDMLGDDLVPDYMTSVQDGGFYGWPYFYFGDHRDERVPIPENVRLRPGIVPDFALGAHTASLGLLFYQGEALPARYRGGAFVGQHGSWNRSAFSGYKVVFVPFANGKPSGAAEDFLTGFLTENGKARGRPVGVAMDRTGALLVADDVGGIVWRVAAE
jgi:glucose/arabinose dehydrogenase